MNYLVTGACGQLGCALRLASSGSRDRWLFTDVCDLSPESFAQLRKMGGEAVDVATARLDVTNRDSVRKMLRDNEIDIVMNAAAYTAVDAAETHPEEARLLNVEAPRILAEAVFETGGLLVHISTDYVFGDCLLREAGSVFRPAERKEPDGEFRLAGITSPEHLAAQAPLGVGGTASAGFSDDRSGSFASGVLLRSDEKVLAAQAPLGVGGTAPNPWRETDMPSPLGVYGKTKSEGEVAVAASGCKYMIVRTAWLYSEFGKNFVKTIMKLTSERPEIRVVDDQFGTPTYAGDLAGTLVKLTQNYHRSGIWHYTNAGQCSWYQFARAIAEGAGHHDCRIDPCTTADYPTPARRPAWSVLDKSRIAEDFGIVPPAWEESLRRCLDRLGHPSGGTETA